MQSPLVKNKIFYPHKAFYKVPYLVPPWSKDEVRLFSRYLINRNNTKTCCFKEKARSKLPIGSNIYLLDSARHALKFLLEALAFPAGSEIIVPILCCGVVPKAILECKLIPSFADIGDDLCLTVESIKNTITPNTKAVVLVHAGGAAAREYKEIVDFCNSKGLYLIDNAAAAWGNDVDGVWLGCRGDSGLVSFGIGKSTFGVGGGMLISRALINNNITLEKRYSIFKLLGFYLRYLRRSYVAPLFMYLDRFIKTSTDNRIEQMSCVDRSLQYQILNNLDWVIKKRTEISLGIIAILDKTLVSFPQENNKHVWTKLIIKLPEKLKISFQRYLYMNRVETEEYHDPFYLNIFWKDKARFSSFGYPVADKLYKELLVLPNSPGLNSCQVKYLYKTIEKFKKDYL